VQLLLDSESHPGLSREELDTFKITYRTEAYTCRYSRCPRASNGFKSDQLRCQHENDVHEQSLKCTVPECKFGLFFASNRALKSHIQKYHSLPSTKNYPQSIRRLLPPSQGPGKASSPDDSLSSPFRSPYWPDALSSTDNGNSSTNNSTIRTLGHAINITAASSSTTTATGRKKPGPKKREPTAGANGDEKPKERKPRKPAVPKDPSAPPQPRRRRQRIDISNIVI
jgi:hypothetical protein